MFRGKIKLTRSLPYRQSKNYNSSKSTAKTNKTVSLLNPFLPGLESAPSAPSNLHKSLQETPHWNFRKQVCFTVGILRGVRHDRIFANVPLLRGCIAHCDLAVGPVGSTYRTTLLDYYLLHYTFRPGLRINLLENFGVF